MTDSSSCSRNNHRLVAMEIEEEQDESSSEHGGFGDVNAAELPALDNDEGDVEVVASQQGGAVQANLESDDSDSSSDEEGDQLPGVSLLQQLPSMSSSGQLTRWPSTSLKPPGASSAFPVVAVGDEADASSRSCAILQSQVLTCEISPCTHNGKDTATLKG